MFVWLKFLGGIKDYDDLLDLMLEEKVSPAPGMQASRISGSIQPLEIWALPTVGTWPAGGLAPLHTLKYWEAAKLPGAAPCSPSAGRGEGLSPQGIPRGCRTLSRIVNPHKDG